MKLHLISEIAFALSQFCQAIFVVATSVVHERQNDVTLKVAKFVPPQFFSGYAGVGFKVQIGVY